MGVLELQLDSVILEVFPNLNDSVILWKELDHAPFGGMCGRSLICFSELSSL